MAVDALPHLSGIRNVPMTMPARSTSVAATTSGVGGELNAEESQKADAHAAHRRSQARRPDGASR